MDSRDSISGNWFLDQLAVYQTANSDHQAVKNNFVIRKVEFQIIIDAILNKKIEDPLQHELILGRRGSGKSTLLKRIEIEIVENTKLNKNFIAINLAEEQAGIYRLMDLWESVISALVKVNHFNIELPPYSNFNTDQAYTRELYSLIHRECKVNKKRIVLLLDNFDRIIENFTDDGSLLRETLINYSDLQIIAGSTRMDEHFWRYDKPFYDFFRTHKLDALSRLEMHDLLQHWSKLLNIDALQHFDVNNPGKIENIRILTDGLPRTLQFFIQIVLQQSETSTYEYLKKTMDNVSPLYQERLGHLTPQLRKIVFEMAFIWEACTTKQLVEKVKMESKLISANLKTLVEKGVVDKIETNKKQHLYRISERFFNMWIIITQGNPDQKRKAKWLTVFLENWYDQGDFEKLTNSHLKNLRHGNVDFKNALVLSKGLSQSKYITTYVRDQIIELTNNLQGSIENSLLELPEKYAAIHNRIVELWNDGRKQESLRLAENIENEEDGFKFRLLGQLNENNGDYALAEKYYLKAIQKGEARSENNLASIFLKQNKINEAEATYLKAIQNDNCDSIYNLANLYSMQKRNREAEKLYLKSIDLGYFESLNNIASIYIQEERFEEAEISLLKARDKKVLTSNLNLGYFYFLRNQFKESIFYYKEAKALGDLRSLSQLSYLFYFTNQNKTEALELIQQAIKFENTNINKISQIIIEIWNGVFDNIENRVIEIINSNEETPTKDLIFGLLVQQQKNLVLKLFRNEVFGKDLQEKYVVLYYVCLILNNIQGENLDLKIPPEIRSTLDEVLESVKHEQKKYGYF